MTLVPLYLMLIAGIFNLCKGFIHGKLFHKGIIQTDRRIGIGELNAALGRATSYDDIRQIRRCKMFCLISLIAFWSFLFLSIMMLLF